MNVLRIINTMDPAFGGPCQGIRNSIPELEKLGVENEVVCLDSPDASFLGKDPFKVHAIGPPKSPWSYSKNLIPWLLENLGRFDAVIVHGLWLYHGYGAMKAVDHVRKSGCQNSNKKIPKLFVMPHGMLDPYFQRAPERKLKAIRNWVYWKLIESHVVNGADGVLFTCEAELLLAREPFRPYSPRSEINVGYGIQNPPTYNPEMHKKFLERCPEVSGKRYILFLSRVHEKKGVDLLILAFQQLVSKGTINDLHLVIAGPGLETPYGQKMQHLVAQHKEIKNLVSFPGMLSGDAKWGAFHGAEAFILPSHQENFGISVVESLACAKPVLISNQVNIYKEIQEAGGGIVSDDTIEGTTSLLKQWHQLPQDVKVKMGVHARKVFEEKFAIATAAKGLLRAVTSKG
jgi:glycosyltransferase involved in cell wall biosynthesis